ncbi:MAG: cobalamin-binding protein [Dehalococcoidia bacterium]|nr:cobalamin-binding protein [Dehalococcoidia bacterium]
MKMFGNQTLARGTNWFLAALLSIVLVLAACTTPVQTPTQYVVDDLGRLVAINGTPQRIISLAPSNTEILFALGLGDKVVGVTMYCDYPPEAQDKEKVGDYYGPDIEKIIALQPDLILATDFHRFDLIPALAEQGFAVFAVAPQTLDDVLESIQKIGEVTGKEAEASQLVNGMRNKIEEIEEQTKELEEKPSVFYMTWHDPMWTVGRNTWIDDLINIAGGVNIFSQYFESGAMVQIEWVILLNPEVIITSEWSYDWALNATELANTNASQTGRIYTFDDDLAQRPGPRLVEGLEWFAHFVHPEIFEEPEGS